MKSILTLLFSIGVAIMVNAQTTNTEQQVEPTKKIAYEVIPAKRVVKPTNEVPIEIKEEQDKQKTQQALNNRDATQGVQKKEPQKKEVVYDLKDEKPKE